MWLIMKMGNEIMQLNAELPKGSQVFSKSVLLFSFSLWIPIQTYTTPFAQTHPKTQIHLLA